jgi:hypothetical protein
MKDFNLTDDILVSTILPQLCTGNTPTDIEATGVDGRGYREVAHVVHVGNSGDTLSGSVKLELDLEHSDDDSTYAAVPAAQVSGAVTGAATGCFGLIDAPAEDSTIFSCVYRGTKRYTRVKVDFTGNHAVGIPLSGFAVKRGPQYMPVSGN